MPWHPNAYLNPDGPVLAELNDNLEHLKAAVDTLEGSTAPAGTLARLGSSGAGAAYVMDGVYVKQVDGTWLWAPGHNRGINTESNVAPGSLAWTVTDGLSRVIAKENWLFSLTGSGSSSIVLGNRHANTATIAGRTVSEEIFFGFRIPSGLTITFTPDTGVTLIQTDGTTAATIVVAGPAVAWFAHGASTWRRL